jgi:Spy/CpxP family protein refolding chaperone
MAKKIGWGLVVGMVVIGITVFAACGRHFSDLQKDIRVVLKGILSPQQISTLIDFRRNHTEKFHWKVDKPGDLFETWKELDLSEEQQEQLLRIAHTFIDKTHPDLMTIIETGSELKRKVLEGDPYHQEIKQLSTRFGTEIGEMLWNLALMHSQARAVLTPEQIEIMEEHRNKHDIHLKNAIQALPDMAEDLAALWSDLKLTPNQVDALEAVYRVVMRYKQDQHVKRHDEWRADIAKILTPEQLAVVDGFHERQVAECRAHFLKRVEERERFHNELSLTGEQKFKLIQIALDRRARIVQSIQDIANAAGGLRKQVHTDIPDRGSLMAAAAGFGDAIGNAVAVGAEFMADAKEVLTTDQMDLFKSHINNHLDQHLKHARIVPAKFQNLIGFLDELNLTSEQKDQIVKWIAEKLKEQRGKHRGMKRFL